jgi:hypothetical protein
MSDGNENKGVLISFANMIVGLLGFAGIVVTAWVMMSERVATLERAQAADDRHWERADDKLDALCEAVGCRTPRGGRQQ